MKKVTLTRPVRNYVDCYDSRKKILDSELTKTSTCSKSSPTLINPPPPSLSLKGEGGWGEGVVLVQATRNKKKLESLLEELESLTATEKKQVLAKLALEQQSGSGRHNRDLDMWIISIITALESTIGAVGRGLAGPQVIKRLCGARSNWVHVEDFLRLSEFSELTVTERQRAMMMLAKLLVEYARQVAHVSNIPMTSKLVANCTAHLPQIFERAFPGYLGSGLARVVARQAIAGVSV